MRYTSTATYISVFMAIFFFVDVWLSDPDEVSSDRMFNGFLGLIIFISALMVAAILSDSSSNGGSE